MQGLSPILCQPFAAPLKSALIQSIESRDPQKGRAFSQLVLLLDQLLQATSRLRKKDDLGGEERKNVPQGLKAE